MTIQARKGVVLQLLLSYCGAGDAPQIGDQGSFIAAVSNGVFSDAGFRQLTRLSEIMAASSEPDIRSARQNQ